MHVRPQTGRSMSRRLLLGISAFVGIGVVSACLYFAQSQPQWGWASQQAATRGSAQLGMEEQNRFIEAIYQVCARTPRSAPHLSRFPQSWCFWAFLSRGRLSGQACPAVS